MNKIRLSSVVVMNILVAALCVGCTVKEDRSECPCLLVLDFSGVDTDRSDSLDLSVMSADDFLYQDVVRNDAYQQLYSVEVPKGGSWINAYSVEAGGRNFSDMLSPDGASLTIPSGQECPEVNMFSQYFNLQNETVVVPVILHKNFCRLSITMTSDEEMNFSLFNLDLSGEICGYDKDGKPVAGEFAFSVPQDSDGIFRGRIPRQVDGTLRLIISDEEEALREFAVGEYIIESGYDWDAEDLEDVSMEINYTKTDVTFNISGWVKTVEMEVVI